LELKHHSIIGSKYYRQLLTGGLVVFSLFNWSLLVAVALSFVPAVYMVGNFDHYQESCAMLSDTPKQIEGGPYHGLFGESCLEFPKPKIHKWHDIFSIIEFDVLTPQKWFYPCVGKRFFGSARQECIAQHFDFLHMSIMLACIGILVSIPAGILTWLMILGWRKLSIVKSS
jgi:hypothetical protein